MTKIVKATSKGQVTIPMEFRREFKTDQYIMSRSGDSIIIKPFDLKKIENETYETERMKEYAEIRKKRNKNDIVIFDAIRDNNGKGISGDDIIRMIKEVDEQD